MFSLRELRGKGAVLEFGYLCGLQDRPDSAQWNAVAGKGGLDTIGVHTESLEVCQPQRFS